MIAINTTFHIPCRIKPQFVRWLRESYVPQACGSGCVTSPVIFRILGGSEETPDHMSMACQLTAPTLAAAKNWHDGHGAVLRSGMHRLWGKDVLYFTTYLEVIPVAEPGESAASEK